MAREKFNFWLDMAKDDELLLAETIDNLKRQRSFTATIRDGIRLIADLRKGNLTVLCELFPWVRAELVDRAGGNSSQTAAIQRQLNDLERLLLGQNNGALMSQAGPKPLSVPKIAAPAPDDSDMPALVIRQAKATGDSGANFLASAFGLQQ